jgi:hypothetical protein
MTQKLLTENGTGAARDLLDKRDRLYRELAASAGLGVGEEDWEKGYDVYAEAGIQPEPRDQGSRSTCVAETCGRYARVLRKLTAKDDVVFSASSLYPLIALPNGGAYLRDGAKFTVAGNMAPKSVLPDELPDGTPISEAAAKDASRLTPEVKAAATKLDVFDSYRMLDGGTDDINLFASAIKTGKGLILGFAGTNDGWVCSVCKPPASSNNVWGHAVYGCAFGKTDVADCGITIGTKAIFTPNSWGGRYTFKTGRWRGYQAIPEAYFQAGESSTEGFIKGTYVFPSWTIIPSAIVPDTQWISDFLRQHDNKLAFCNPGTGAFAIIADGKFLRVKDERTGHASLTCLMRGIDKSRVVNIDKETWDKLPQDYL